MKHEERFPSSLFLLPTSRHAERGVTLIDTVIGAALVLVAFVGIASVFQLSIDVVMNNRARAGAIALGNEWMEYVRSLTYDKVGTVGGIPAGPVPQSDTVILNGISYTRRTTIQYVDDPYDGLGIADTFPTASPVFVDYKAVRVAISWQSRQGERTVYFVTRVEPQNGKEVACEPPTCGTLFVQVENATSQPVVNAQVRVTNANASPAIDVTTFTNVAGQVVLAGAPLANGYHVVASKPGYNSAQTYPMTQQNPSPDPSDPNLAVSGATVSRTLKIDLVSSMTITTYSLTAENWQDLFNDGTKLDSAHSSNVEIAGNQLRLAGNQPFLSPGEARSVQIAPTALSRWKVFSWNDTRPSETTIVYHVYYPDSGGLTLVPDSALPGNSTGFTGTSVDVSTIPAATYSSLVLGATLTALNPNAPAPSIQDWGLTYDGGGTVNVTLSMHGEKKICVEPCTLYKYDNSSITTAGGTVTLGNLEWDRYTASIVSSSGYDIASSCTPQPIDLQPNSSAALTLYFAPDTANSLLVDVKNASSTLLSGATINLKKGGSYDTTVIADKCGQGFFSGLTNGNYTLTVSNPGNQTSIQDVNVSGAKVRSVTLN